MENNNKIPKLMFEKYTWKMANFSKLNRGANLHSDKFILNGFTWYIVIVLPRDTHDYMEFYLDADKDCPNLPQGWKKTANLNLALINQINDRMTIRRGFEFEFSAKAYFNGMVNMLSWSELNKPDSGFIVNDTCVVEVGIFVTKFVDANDEYHSVCNTDDNPTNDNDNSSFQDMFRNSFKFIEQNFVPVLEDVCLQVPSLVVSQEKRSWRFTHWAFTALGRVLHFLNTKKMEDMDEEACNHLQSLWDEVNAFGFDLTWLEFHVEYALEMKSYKENDAMDVKKVKENIDALEIETNWLRKVVISKEKELEMARRNLLKAERFEENKNNFDKKLGYGPY